jgi:hypothetical protein
MRAVALIRPVTPGNTPRFESNRFELDPSFAGARLARRQFVAPRGGAARAGPFCGKEDTVRKLCVSAALVAVGVVVLAVGSYATGSHGDWQDRARRFSARLSGFQEVPVNSTTGQGTLFARLDELNSATVIEYKLSYRKLEGTVTLAAHIHLGQRDVNGGIAAFLCGGGDKPPCPATEGSVEGIIDAADVIGPAGQGIAPGEINELITMMRAGLTYANVHTNKHPAGEIRGQIDDQGGGHDDHRGHDRD